jgi:thiamine-phosphate pyrophosphorylase
MRGLYLVTPNWDDTDRLLAATEAGLRGGAVLVQYRHKEAPATLRQEQGAALLALCRRYRVPFVVNDHLDLAIALDADGVHLGGADGDLAHARQVLGPTKIIGASCYGELPLAVAAQQAGASYVAFGGFYPSLVKQYSFVTQPGLLDEARAVVSVPIVVIGGMTVANAAPLVARGADMVAAISSVYTAPRAQAAAQAFAALFATPPKAAH